MRARKNRNPFLINFNYACPGLLRNWPPGPRSRTSADLEIRRWWCVLFLSIQSPLREITAGARRAPPAAAPGSARRPRRRRRRARRRTTGGAAAARPRAARLAPAELAELDAARRRRRRRRGVVDAWALKTARGEARQRQPGERDEDGRYGLLARRRRRLAVARPLRRCRCRSAASARPGGAGHSRRRRRRAGVAARRRPARFAAARRVARVARPAAPRRAGVPSRRARRPPPPARRPSGAAAAAAAFVAPARAVPRASSARVRLWRCTSWACLMAVACWARARARGARFPACGAPPTEARSARGVFPGAGCALGAAWLTVVTCPAPGGASAAATARRDIMRVISTELIFF